MERIMTPEERMRRAEEIYYRRQSQGGVRLLPTTVSNNKISLGRKMLIQIIVCVIVYGFFWGLKNKETIFSQNVINKTKEVLNYDINFQNVYGKCLEYFNNNINNNINNIVPIVNDNVQENEGKNIENDSEINNENSVENNGENINTLNNDKIENNFNNVIEQNSNVENQSQDTENLGIGGGSDTSQIGNENKTQMELDADFIKKNYSLINPIQGKVTSRFGNREPTEIISAFHQGIDIGASIGTPINAAMEGVVVESSYAGDYGNYVKIKNGDILTVYAHCSQLCVTTGDYITQGQVIAKVGNTGKVTGPHLHFEIRRENRYVNPDLILIF